VSKRQSPTLTAWLAGVALALAFCFAAARCAVDVELGVDPRSDAGATDASADSD
jgi:hypothetical protein